MSSLNHLTRPIPCEATKQQPKPNPPQNTSVPHRPPQPNPCKTQHFKLTYSTLLPLIPFPLLLHNLNPLRHTLRHPRIELRRIRPREANLLGQVIRQYLDEVAVSILVELRRVLEFLLLEREGRMSGVGLGLGVGVVGGGGGGLSGEGELEMES